MGIESQADVMRHNRMFRLDLHGRDPGVFLETARDSHRHPFDDVVLWMRRDVRRGPFDNDVRLNLPAFGPLDRRRRVLWVAFRGSGIGPLGNRVDLVMSENQISLRISAYLSRLSRASPEHY